MNKKLYINAVDQCWAEISKNVKEALVFMDDPSAECLHWHGGLKRFLEKDAVSVENFSPFVKADSHMKKVVFILSSPITDEALRTLMVIIRANNFKSCTVISSLSAKFHSDESSEMHQNFILLEDRILDWMGNLNYTALIYHIPFFASFITQELFIMPSFCKQFSILKCAFLEMNRKRTIDNNLRNLSKEMQSSIKQLTCCLTSLMDSFQVKADIFSIGPLSHVLGSELETYVQYQKKKPFSSKVSVVLVDRLLDLAGPLSQSYETMFDCILKRFPHLSGHVFDVNIPMNDLAACKNESVFGRPLLAPGCLAHKNNPAEISALNTILSKRPREVLIEINHNLVECAAKEGLNLDLSSQLTVDILRKRCLSFRGKPKLMSKYSGLLQQTLAVVKALEHLSDNTTEHLSATEKALMQYLTSSTEEVMDNIIQMICERDEMNCKMEEVLIFLAFIYMLSANSNIANESAVQATLMEAFFQDDDMTELASLFVEGELEDDSILNSIRTLFDVLRRLSTMRKGLKKYSSVFKSTNPAFPATYNPLIKQLLEDIFNTTITDIPDIEFHSAGLKDYIKTGFSLFMNVGKPQPRDNSIIFLIIVGGITPVEIKLIKDIAAHHKGNEIIVGCTEVLTATSVFKDLGLVVKELSQESYRDNDI